MVLAEEFSRLENSVNLSESRVWPLSKFCPMPLALFAIIERQLKNSGRVDEFLVPLLIPQNS